MSYELYEKLREESDGDGLTLSAAIKVNMIEGIVEVTITGAIKVKFNGSEQIKDANQRTFDFDED